MAEHRSTGRRNGGQNNDGASEPKVISQALRKEGNVGGVSGTGQAFPHRGFIQADEQDVLGHPVGDHARLPEPEVDGTYQTGGTHLNRQRMVALRKHRLAGGTIASKAHDGLDPPPGAPASRS